MRNLLLNVQMFMIWEKNVLSKLLIIKSNKNWKCCAYNAQIENKNILYILWPIENTNINIQLIYYYQVSKDTLKNKINLVETGFT